MSIGILVNDMLEATVRFTRRTVPPATRDAIDRRLQGPTISVLQFLISLKRRNKHLGIAEERILPKEEEATRGVIESMNASLHRRYNTRIAERAGNTKTYGLLRAEFRVLPHLPDNLRVGIFKSRGES